MIELSEDRLGAIFQGTLTLLYRLLFLLYAESRGLLPVHAREYRDASLQHLKESIREVAGTIADETEKHINKQYSTGSYELWQKLKRLFHVIDAGSEELNVPRYNGGLFLADRDKNDHSPEAEAARFLERERVPDRYLARAIDLLARGIDPKHHDLAFVDYKSLGVRQLGSIYEGLLEFQLRMATEKLGVIKEKGREVYKAFRELSDREKARAETKNDFVQRGDAYLENDKRENSRSLASIQRRRSSRSPRLSPSNSRARYGSNLSPSANATHSNRRPSTHASMRWTNGSIPSSKAIYWLMLTTWP